MKEKFKCCLNKKNLVFFLIAFVPRLIYLFQIRSNPFFDHLILDPKYYDEKALNILSGDWLSGDAVFDLSPIYPYFLALIYGIFGRNFFIVRFIQIVLGAVNCVLIYKIGEKIFNRSVGLIAFLIASFYGVFFFYEGIIQTESMVLFFNSLLILFLLNQRYFLSGFLLGISIIIRPNILIVVPCLILWFIITMQVTLKKISSCWPVFSLCLGIFLMVFPVTLRNYIVSQDFVLISSSGGMNFYIGNNPKATGILTEPDFIRPNPLFEHTDARLKAEELVGHPLSPSEASRFWFNKGLRFIWDNPGQFLSLLKKKTFYLVNYYEIPDNINVYFFKRFSSILRLPLFSSRIIIPLGLLGLMLCVIQRQRADLLYIFSGGYIIFLLMFFVSSRYRLPLIPFLIIFSAYSVQWFQENYKTPKKIVFPLLVLISLFVLANREDKPLKNIFLSHSHLMLSNVYYETGALDKAEHEVRQAVKINPQNREASNNLAWIYAEKGVHLDEALSLALKSAKSDPENPNYYDTLSWVYYKMDRKDDSRAALEKGLEIDPMHENMLKLKKLMENFKK